MPALNEIPGIGVASMQLLESAGIRSAEELAAQDTDHLVAELKRANELLSVMKSVPGKATVMKWIAGAMDLIEGEDEETAKQESVEPLPEAPTQARPASATPVNYEANAEVAEMISRAPCAIPLPGKNMMEKGLRVSDVPAGLLLNRYSGNLDVRIGDPSAPKSDVPSRRPTGNVESISQQATRRHFEASSAKPISASPNGGKRVPVSKNGHEEDRVALIRAPREETNRGKDPESRRYIRGVLHGHPWSLRLGAVFSLLLLINLPVAIVSGFLLLASREYPETFPWVPEWILGFPIALPLTGLGYLFWGMTGKCRICTQKLFVHKGALKHMKAHRISGMGFVIPLCLHLLAFSWFRCSSCGTPVRLKK
jgi:hypothetical protein